MDMEESWGYCLIEVYQCLGEKKVVGFGGKGMEMRES